MIWKIAQKEFLLNLMTFKFAVGKILCIILWTSLPYRNFRSKTLRWANL